MVVLFADFEVPLPRKDVLLTLRTHWLEVIMRVEEMVVLLVVRDRVICFIEPKHGILSL